MLTQTAPRRVHFDDLLDVAPANDVGHHAPPLLRVVSRPMSATVGVDSEDNLYAGLSYDVATGGIFVATADLPAVGTRVDVTVTMPDMSQYQLSGIVRWVRDVELASDGLPMGCGVEWKGLPLDASRALAKFAELREPLLWLAEVA
jgi:Tfp pilus assembly protein PilZ